MFCINTQASRLAEHPFSHNSNQMVNNARHQSPNTHGIVYLPTFGWFMTYMLVNIPAACSRFRCSCWCDQHVLLRHGSALLHMDEPYHIHRRGLQVEHRILVIHINSIYIQYITYDWMGLVLAVLCVYYVYIYYMCVYIYIYIYGII